MWTSHLARSTMVRSVTFDDGGLSPAWLGDQRLTAPCLTATPIMEIMENRLLTQS